MTYGRLVSLCLMSLSLVPGLFAQADTSSIRVMGTVRDQLRQPISGAEVHIIGTPITAFTSDSGLFRLGAPRVVPLVFQIRRPGYRAQLLKVNSDWSGSIVMQQGTYELPAIQVTARMAKPVAYAATHKYDDFFFRQRLGFGEFVTREQIDRRLAAHTPQLLEGRPGIHVDFRYVEAASGSPSTIIAFARCNEFPPKINVYLDGHKLMPRIVNASGGDLALQILSREVTQKEIETRREIRGMVAEMLERINPSDIELMEIYRGPGELPGEFNDGNCGAIVIWTREGGR
jgi:hypothetical protein